MTTLNPTLPNGGKWTIPKVRAFVVLLFVVYPLGALPPVLAEIWNRKGYAFTLLALFMGLCAVLIAPGGDLYRHTVDYFSFRDMSCEDAFADSFRLDFIMYGLSYLFAQWGIHFELVRFLFVFVSYQCVFCVFRDIVRQNAALRESRRNCFLAFLAVFCSVSFFTIAFGLRYGTAAYLMATGIYWIFHRRRPAGWILALLAGLTHFSVIPIFLLCVALRCFPVRLNKWLVYIFLIFAFAFGSQALEAIILQLPLPELVQSHMLAYVSGYWANEYLGDHSLFFRIASFLTYVPIYPLVFFFLLSYRRKDSRCPYKRVLLVFTLLIGALHPIENLFLRYSILLIPVFVFDRLIGFKPSRPAGLLVVSLFLAVSFLCQVYANRRDFPTIHRFGYFLYSPAPAILCQQFDEEWIIMHINEDGSSVAQ